MSHTRHVYVSPILLTTLFFLLAVAPLAASDSRWYLNVKLGQGSLDADLGKFYPKHFEGDDPTSGFELGFVLHRHLAVQAGYHDLGRYDGFGVSCPEDGACIEIYPPPTSFMTADLSGLSLSLVPRLPLQGDRLTLYGKLGVIDWDRRIDAVGNYGLHETLSDSDLLSGLGVRYGFKNGLGVLAEYERFDFDQESASLGASWRF